ncbi:quinone-modifying oxidoreductase subunit QmoC [Desulfacinum hydrothermale DSM 13146]|uniref:Quinone-modifying oxidoreductase subunit QmoC n=1 Tax=Desulfacinum hydrothermale DSM 13146 TaxID=1121390 RepID=A0A1W1X0K5_9BACT|nr:4Fe-4S dicluster domain-containing protein [Desulfacinum hydrothermale]SMC17248.1 quinone-modifying oxidoreductase subunit QmoC [Desulfacinum hydrothermale DSM 13146]
MSIKVDPNLMKDLKHFGLKDASKCFHCGNCTAVCPLSETGTPFPRKLVKYAQMGLKDKILQSSEPWLCYYCGECSDRCPRGADPGETMMVMRRYLTSQYDWTGFSRRFYTSEKFETMAVVAVGLFVGLLMLLFAQEFDWQNASLEKAWPAAGMEIADLIMAAILSFFLLSNVWRFMKFTMGDLLTKIPLRIYASEAKQLVLHFLTQKRWAKCEDRTQWIIHLLIMTGYTTAFILVAVLLCGGLEVIGLNWDPLRFQRPFDPTTGRDMVYPFFHPIRLLGYYATISVLIGATYALLGRSRRSKTPYKNSHGTDWMFLVLLELTVITGIAVHILRIMNIPFALYALYIIHLMVAVPMLVLEVPFAKWAHLAYRPMAAYLKGVKETYYAELEGKKAEAPAQAEAEAV